MADMGDSNFLSNLLYQSMPQTEHIVDHFLFGPTMYLSYTLLSAIQDMDSLKLIISLSQSNTSSGEILSVSKSDSLEEAHITVTASYLS